MDSEIFTFTLKLIFFTSCILGALGLISAEPFVRSLLVSFFGTLVFPITALFVMTPIFKLNGVWLSSTASCTLSAMFTIFLYLTIKDNKEFSK